MAKKATAKPVKKSSEKKPAKSSSSKVRIPKIVKDSMSKSQLVSCLVDATDLSKKQVSSVVENLVEIIHAHVRKGAAGVFNFPGLMKMTVVRKPATKARKGVNPFTGQEMMFKAKPARNVVKIRVLKKLKDSAA